MDNVKVSVIVPAYNAGDTLEKCIDSILAQTLDEIEIIIVNDGSIDGTYEIISEYERKYPDKIVGIHKENAGVSAARNDGLDAAKGTYIGFVDADDTIEPMMYELLYTKAQNTNAGLVQCWRKDIYNGRTVIKKPGKKCVGKSIITNPEILSNQTMFVWDKLFMASIIKEHNVRFKYRYAEDFLFLIQYEMFCQNIGVVRIPLYNYRAQRTGAVTSTISESMLDMPLSLKSANDIVMSMGFFTVLERELWRVEAWCYIRRINAFYLDKNKEKQLQLVKEFFVLFDTYFFGWKTTIRKTGARTKIEYRYNAFRSDLSKMQKFIYQPLVVKKIRRKLVFILSGATVKLKNIPKRLSTLWKNIKKFFHMPKEYKKKIKEHAKSIKYAKFIKEPINEKAVLLTSYYGSSFSDSMFYMAQDLLARQELTVYVGINSIHREKLFSMFNKIEPTLVDVNSDDYLRVLATSKYIVNNSRFPSFFSKRKGQVYLNTWHGTPLKALGKDMKHGLSDVGNNQSNFLMCDYLLYPNEYTRDAIMNSFFLNKLYTGNVIMCGYPRNSVFYSLTDDETESIKSSMGLSGKKLYMYMPTWRGETLNTAAVTAYGKQLLKMLNEIDKALNDDVIFFVKLHQVVMRKIKMPNYKHIRTAHPLYENYKFLGIMDCLITDYSSVFFDFANTRKNILLFTYDYDEYIEQRGVYFDMNSLPFKRVNTVNELIECINSDADIGIDESQYDKFLSEYCRYDSARSAAIANDILLTGRTDGDTEIINYRNNEKLYKIYFMSNLAYAEQRDVFSMLIKRDSENSIFVFSQHDFIEKTDEVLSEYANLGILYIVVQGEMPATKSELIKLALFRKYKWFKNDARRLYKQELDRILPTIGISEIVNCSNNEKFNDICCALGEDIKCTKYGGIFG